MTHSHHRRRCGKKNDVYIQRAPLERPFPRGDDPGRATHSLEGAPMRPFGTSGASPPAQAMVALPADVYLIGCDADVAMNLQASAQTMGFKAWNLLRMAQMALPVPPAFVLGTHYCIDPSARQAASRPDVWLPGLHALEHATGLVFGDIRRPLLLSVRSGAPVSMPGMMETLLNIGLCDATVGGFVRQTGNPRLVWDAYRRLVAAYAEVVAGLPAERFEEAVATLVGARDERDLDFTDLRELTRRFLSVYEHAAGQPFPQAPRAQLAGAVEAVFASWQSAKACEYRRLNDVSDAIGTAVTVQAMVFGNAGGQSGAGVGFTRDPATGESALLVDFLFNAQGEDVVSGRHSARGHAELAAVLPAAWLALQDAARQLECTFCNMQEFEFTVQEGRLFMLQTRDGKRTPRATVRIALDMLKEGLIDADLARERTAGLDRAALAQSCVVAPNGEVLVPLARTTAASNGVAIGELALDEARAMISHAEGKPIILVRRDAETSDIGALALAAGLLTQRGARTSHAAVVARQLGKVCLVGCADLQIDETARTVKLGGAMLREGDMLTLDGNDGSIYAGVAQTEINYPEELLTQLASLRQHSDGEA